MPVVIKKIWAGSMKLTPRAGVIRLFPKQGSIKMTARYNQVDPSSYDPTAIMNAFKARVLADSGVFEADSCLVSQLTTLQNFYDRISLLLTPNGYKTSKLYSALPINGTGDFAFTRSTTGTRKGASLVETMAINTPRLDSTGSSCPSILLEPQRTNLLLRSEQFDDVSWLKGDTTVTPNNINSPDGLQTADLLTQGVAGTASITENATISSNSVITYSTFLKRGNTDWIAVIYGDNALAVNYVGVYVNINTGAVGSHTTAGACTLTTKAIDSIGNGWYRVKLTGTVGGGFTIARVATYAATGDGTGLRQNNATYYQWGAQLEQASYATSYIPTTSATVTRVADSPTPLTGVSALIGQTQGTIYLEGNSFADSTSKFLSISDGTNNNRVIIGFNLLNQIEGAVVAGGVVGADLFGASTAFVTGVAYKIAFTYQNNKAALFVNGVKKFEDLTVTVPATNRVQFNYADGTLPLYGLFKNFSLLPTALSDSEAITLTT